MGRKRTQLSTKILLSYSGRIVVHPCGCAVPLPSVAHRLEQYSNSRRYSEDHRRFASRRPSSPGAFRAGARARTRGLTNFVNFRASAARILTDFLRGSPNQRPSDLGL